MNEFDFSKLPDKIKNGLNEYYRLWNTGLKKKANVIIRDTMEYYDTLSAEVHQVFAEIICNKVCDNQTSITPHDLPYEISKRLSKELLPYVEENIFPQALWYCEIFGTSEDIFALYQKNKDSLKAAELLMSDLIHYLDFGAHHFPEFSCIKYTGVEEVCNLGNEILENHSVNEDLRKEFEYYVKLHKLFYSWDKSGDFFAFCEKNGLEFFEIGTYYYH